jgi:hypothetical protein
VCLSTIVDYFAFGSIKATLVADVYPNSKLSFNIYNAGDVSDENVPIRAKFLPSIS